MLEAIQQLNARAGAQGVGRLDMVEDRLVGIKSREVYEAPGALTLIEAHRQLEDLTLEKDAARFKRTVEQRWSELVYDGLWFSPLKRALDAFIDEASVTSPATSGWCCTVAARSSPAGAARLAVRLQPRDVRRRGHLRPAAGEGLRRAVGPAQPDRRTARPAAGDRARPAAAVDR